MRFISYLSELLIPLVIFIIVAIGILKKTNVYEDFLEGAREGIKTAVSLLPTLIGLMLGVKVLQSSGLLTLIPTPILPVVVVRLFSSSAATSLCLELFEQYGTDSVWGMMASIILSCTESVFYTMSVYFMTARISKTRWTLPGALVATVSGVAASIAVTLYLTH